MSRRAVIVCGAGVSSSFLARAVREAADQHDLEWEVIPLAEDQLASIESDISLVLVGHHLAARFDVVRDAGTSRGVAVRLLSSDVHATAALEVVELLRALELSPDTLDKDATHA